MSETSSLTWSPAKRWCVSFHLLRIAQVQVKSRIKNLNSELDIVEKTESHDLDYSFEEQAKLIVMTLKKLGQRTQLLQEPNPNPKNEAFPGYPERLRSLYVKDDWPDNITTKQEDQIFQILVKLNNSINEVKIKIINSVTGKVLNLSSIESAKEILHDFLKCLNTLEKRLHLISKST